MIEKKENLRLRHRCYHFESTGKIVYDPQRNGTSEPWSAILEVEQDFIDYYRLLFNNHFKVNLLRPNWKAHISLFRGQPEYTPELEKYWGEFNGKEVTFVYTQDFFWNEHFVWLNTYFQEYFDLRKKTNVNSVALDVWSHITIGKFRKPGQLGSFPDFSKEIPKKYNS